MDDYYRIKNHLLVLASFQLNFMASRSVNGYVSFVFVYAPSRFSLIEKMDDLSRISYPSPVSGRRINGPAVAAIEMDFRISLLSKLAEIDGLIVVDFSGEGDPGEWFYDSSHSNYYGTIQKVELLNPLLSELLVSSPSK